MKKFTSFLTLFFLLSSGAFAQTKASLAPDQNPNYLQSQNKYVAMADSLTAWHTTTLQDTYKAYDYLEAKAERKAERRNFRRELRRIRAERTSYYNTYRRPYNYYNYYGAHPFNNSCNFYRGWNW